jgi:hypothetical protein
MFHHRIFWFSCFFVYVCVCERQRDSACIYFETQSVSYTYFPAVHFLSITNILFCTEEQFHDNT